MALRQETCFIAVCDDCGREHEQDYVVHWPSKGDAIDGATDDDWYGDEKALLCDPCRYKPHAVVPDGNCCARCGIDADDHDPVKEPT